MINAKCYIYMDNMYTQMFHSHFIILVTKDVASVPYENLTCTPAS